MNNRGFTLVELLATIVILALVTGIGIVSYTGYLNRSKEKAEQIFKKNISDYIDAFITSNTPNFTDDIEKAEGVYTQKFNNKEITFQDLIDDRLITESNLKNSTNNKTCSSTTKITVYRDKNYVYCFNVELDCLETGDTNVTNCSSYITNKIGG